jgi:hypothetical protein
MFKSFDSFNQHLDKLIPSADAVAMGNALAISKSVQEILSSVSSRYTRAYNSVQVIKYDENGDPIDVTPAEQLTVPENILEYARATIDNVKNQISTYRDRFSTVLHNVVVPLSTVLTQSKPFLLGRVGFDTAFFSGSDVNATLITYMGSDGTLYDYSASGHTLLFTILPSGLLPDKVSGLHKYWKSGNAWVVAKNYAATGTAQAFRIRCEYTYYPGSGTQAYVKNVYADVTWSGAVANPSVSFSVDADPTLVSVLEGVTPEEQFPLTWVSSANVGKFVSVTAGTDYEQNTALHAVTLGPLNIAAVDSDINYQYSSADISFNDLVISDQALDLVKSDLNP